MARNRKRAKERRRAQAPVGAARPTARPAAPESEQPIGAARQATRTPPAPEEPEYSAPEPLAHAVPDAELAQAQLALGEPVEETPEEEEELAELAVGGGGRGGGRSGAAAVAEEDGGGELAAPASAAPAPRLSAATRLVTFLQGCWAELQRVQWPDRRQVMQATGVVIGFVIVAGVFLGVADWVAGKLMDFVLK